MTVMNDTKTTIHSPDIWESIARDAAHRMPPSDYGSTRVIQDVARLLREAYQRGRDEAMVHAAMERRLR